MKTVGIDEVGRGCWAGPLVAGAVLLGGPIEGLTDSKLLSRARREALAPIIEAEAVAVGLGWVWPAEVDDWGISQAVKVAMQRALEQIAAPYDEVIVDGNINYLADNLKTRALIKADLSEPSVSAASIVAKVARDRYMADLPAQYAGYGFASHVGYGTSAHRAALNALGVSDIHRRSYKPIKALLA
jgi:ribonuclease HII